MKKIVKTLKRHCFRKPQVIKVISVFLAFNILLEAIAPLSLFAISGGPNQPETQGFEPIGTTQMVDPFTGDFTYNIPLMDIDGYPINISYHSSVTMDQEASWVGLGWSLSPGSINRGMRGIPDDFNGEEVTKNIKMKDNSTYGVSVGIGGEIFGKKSWGKAEMNAGLGFFYNNYTGIGCEITCGPSFSISKSSKSKSTWKLGATLSLNSDNGVSIDPNISYGYRISKCDSRETSFGLHTGCSYNSRAGLSTISFGGNFKKAFGYKTAELGGNQNFGSTFNFGMPTYTPQINYSMNNSAGTASFTLGIAAVGFHGNVNARYYYSHQKLLSNTILTPAYGYFNSENGQQIAGAMHDINREKDGSFNTITVALPITNYTYDIYSVTGQGVGGSYRPFRSEMGHVFDPAVFSETDSWSAGGEVGASATFHGGLDINVAEVNVNSGQWQLDNAAAAKMNFQSSPYDLYEKCYFKEANEKSVNSDPLFLEKIGGYNPVRVKLSQERIDALDIEQYDIDANAILTDGNGNDIPIPDENYRLKRDRRNQSISFATRQELLDGLGLMSGDFYNNNISTLAKSYHIGEITALNTSGQRYVYGIAAYNLSQEETTFAVSESEENGCVTYTDVENSLDNVSGRDNYYSNTIMPAYAHSYLLTAVLSPDYVDSDWKKGPSDGDIGNYTKFNYKKVLNGYKWRTPMGLNKASFQEGLRSIDYDNKASYIYGSKELWYLDTIETKNYIAIFTVENRKDGYGVTDKNGTVGGEPMKLLRKISLYSKLDFRKNGISNATPIKEVHFVYDYSLCVGVPNNRNEQGSQLEPNQGGKLTLKSIYFTYGKSNKAALSPYKFKYSNENPSYQAKANDRWGNYKPIVSGSGFGTLDSLPNSEYPYVKQNKAIADQYAQVWALTEIGLPSGGKINVEYESDDYAYVQNKKAMQMYKICGLGNTNELSESIKSVNMESGDIAFRVKLEDAISDKSKYVEGIDTVYFRFLMKMSKMSDENSMNNYEYVSGYGKVKSFEIDPNNTGYGLLTMNGVSLKDDDGGDYCPAIKAAVLFGRLNLTKEVYNRGFNVVNEGAGATALEIINSLINAVGSLDELFVNANRMLFWEGVGSKMILNKSWIRLNNVTGHKYGGGSRVKRIFISDEWDQMTSNDGPSNYYGQEYSYVNTDGSSSGVASYEPQMGGDENPWKMPVASVDADGKDGGAPLAADDDHYVETPFGECFFPSPNVGYSRVTIKNIYKDANTIINNKSGSVVHEFYTAKDFPTITSRTDLKMLRAKSKPFSLRSLFKIDVKDYCTVSQGYLVEVNDMHGKPKSQHVFQEGNIEISSVQYNYKKTSYENNYRLDNTVKAINSNGVIDNQATIGVFADFVSDMREENSYAHSGGVELNVDVTWPAFTIIPWPAKTSERTQFRSAVVTKVIQRFGILESTTAKDLGFEVSTSNLAYDAETGEVLVTQTTTNFNDNVYSITFPAYWHYDGMGAAYKNIGYTKAGVSFANGLAIISDAQGLFVEGDELAITKSPGEIIKGWVSQVMLGRIRVIDRVGNKVEDMNNATLKIMRSGRKNQQSTPMATITSLSNPLANIQGNFYENVLQASAIEYSNTWKTFCDCFTPSKKDDLSAWAQYMSSYTYNPFIMGTKGMYKPNRSFLHLSERTQSNYNNNTNIRKDGVFASFTPYYKLSSGKWNIDSRNWTFTSEVTQFSPFGAELENRDALGHYSAALFGYNQSLATAVAANSKYREVGVDNFEDYGFSRCADNHFKFNKEQPVNIVEGISHTGRHSIKVPQDTAITMVKQLVLCNECDTSGVVNNNLNFVNYKVTGGTAPYNISWTCDENEIDISMGADQCSVAIEKVSSLTYHVTVKVMDRNGCTHYKTFNFINGVLQ